jgi:integrase
MAKINQRAWRVPGRRTKRKAWGYTTVINGAQRRCYKAAWTKEDAEKALSELVLNIEPPKKRQEITLAQAAERYLAEKARKLSLGEDKRLLAHLKSAFGPDTNLSDITAGRISAYKAQRLASVSVRRKDENGQPARLGTASINRPLALLRHLLRLAHEEWEVLPAVPRIRLEKEPQGRIRWLEPDEEARLLDACRASRTPHLAAVVTLALETGLRKGELLGLTWDRVDLSRGVIRLEVTKNGRRREVPIRQIVYNILSGLPGPREGRVWPSSDIRSAFETAVKAGKLDDFHFHDTRHHFASWFVMRGGKPQSLMELLGHSSLAMTMRYAHLAPKHLRDEMAKTERPAPSMEPENLPQDIGPESART